MGVIRDSAVMYDVTLVWSQPSCDRTGEVNVAVTAHGLNLAVTAHGLNLAVTAHGVLLCQVSCI